jgi:hypothetical protein
MFGQNDVVDGCVVVGPRCGAIFRVPGPHRNVGKGAPKGAKMVGERGESCFSWTHSSVAEAEGRLQWIHSMELCYKGEVCRLLGMRA